MKILQNILHVLNAVVLVAVIVLVPCIDSNVLKAGNASQRRETVLDRVSHIDEPLITEIPKIPRLCDQTGTLNKQYVNIGDCNLYVETEGTGTPIVLINGGPGGTHHDFHPYFSEAAKFARVIYYDQRGCGLSDFAKGKSGYTFPQAVDDLDKLREALGIDKWITVGWSYGGCLVQNYLVKYPEHAAGLVLVGASEATPLSLNKTRQFDYISRKEQQKIGNVKNNEILSEEQKLFNAHMYGDWKRQRFYRPTSEELARMALYEWKHDKDFRNDILGTMKSIEIPNVFDKCPVAVLIFEGAWDLTWNTDKAEKLHAVFPDSKLMVLKQAGHKMFADESGQFFAALKEFVSNRRNAREADITVWRSQVEISRKRIEEEDKQVTDAVIFQASQNAPEGFVTWTFFWKPPKFDKGAKVGYVVNDDNEKEYYKWGPNRIGGRGTHRSDFEKAWTGEDASVLYNKKMKVKFWTTKGKIRTMEDIKFEFRDKDGKVIKRTGSVKVAN
jgi:proline iminopeptidase